MPFLSDSKIDASWWTYEEDWIEGEMKYVPRLIPLAAISVASLHNRNDYFRPWIFLGTRDEAMIACKVHIASQLPF